MHEDTGARALRLKTHFNKVLRKLLWFAVIKATIVAFGLRRVKMSTDTRYHSRISLPSSAFQL